ncbi:hypothetical protein [Arenibacterium sp. LLYu02]|uniref:hypothetical protein n=1 Tax=Arenibacterium sp. LLYu02 TaxID=3404132 RepID=UPI003B223C07
MFSLYLCLFGLICGLYHFNSAAYWWHFAAALVVMSLCVGLLLIPDLQAEPVAPSMFAAIVLLTYFAPLVLMTRGALCTRRRLLRAPTPPVSKP